MRIGYGYDCHAFCEGDHVFIGGIKIPFAKAVQAHSDGDVLLHAICDALLGAMGLGDIGQHFPDTDLQYRNLASSQFITQIMALLKERSYRIANIDATVITQAPKLKDHIGTMRQHIAQLVEMAPTDVNIKATTNEKMGWIGQGEGLAAHAVVLLFAPRE